MKAVISIAAMLAFCGSAYAGEGAHWGYSGEEGPENWAQLSPEYSACTGRNQSPVDLTGFIEAELEPIEFAYEAGGEEILNNGHTVQVNYAADSTIALDGKRFELKQFHFHGPSENTIEGKSFPIEAHLVHADGDGNLAVIAVMFTEGEPNAALQAAWSEMPEKAGDKTALPAAIEAEGILPESRDYYRFNGSLTTPPCSEGVWWLVMKEPVSASKEQIDQFVQVMGHANNRPVQAVNARPLLQ